MSRQPIRDPGRDTGLPLPSHSVKEHARGAIATRSEGAEDLLDHTPTTDELARSGDRDLLPASVEKNLLRGSPIVSPAAVTPRQDTATASSETQAGQVPVTRRLRLDPRRAQELNRALATASSRRW